MSMPYRPTRFNAIVGLDLKWCKDARGAVWYVLNILDLAIGFNMSIIMPNKEASTVAESIYFQVIRCDKSFRDVSK